MGAAQGRALAERIRAAVAGAGLATRRSCWPTLRPVVSGPLRGGGAGRELFRHFAHQAERLEGLAEAADLPLDALLELQLRIRSGPGVPQRADAGDWIVRESRPVVGFRSLDLTLPWLVPAVAGVNEAGLALAASWPGIEPGGAHDVVACGGAVAAADHRAGATPPILLVQDCLARFEDLAGALDWCAKRPVEGALELAIADAEGAAATVVFAGRDRRVERAASGAIERPGLVRVDPVRRELCLGADRRSLADGDGAAGPN